MEHPLSQTPGARRARLRRKRVRVTIAIDSVGRLVDTVDRSRPPRACACCGTAFQPSRRRRMLCRPCFVAPRGAREYTVLGVRPLR